jgi:hypothetical protein
MIDEAKFLSFDWAPRHGVNSCYLPLPYLTWWWYELWSDQIQNDGSHPPNRWRLAIHAVFEFSYLRYWSLLLQFAKGTIQHSTISIQFSIIFLILPANLNCSITNKIVYYRLRWVNKKSISKTILQNRKTLLMQIN